MLVQITGFFPHLTHLLHELIAAGVITCHHVRHPHGYFCQLTVNPGGPMRLRTP